MGYHKLNPAGLRARYYPQSVKDKVLILKRGMMKRLVDIVFAICWIILTTPVMILIALLIRLELSGPVLYSTVMVGKNGKTFSLLRFRTMRHGSSPDSPKNLTRVGNFIRNYSLDHLPMWINLLKGDLTIVGPRPMEPYLVDRTDPIWEQYFLGKPGLINYAILKLGKLWTLTRTSHPALNQKLELEYRKKQSVAQDFRLLLQALQAYVVSKGNVKARGEPDPKYEKDLGK